MLSVRVYVHGIWKSIEKHASKCSGIKWARMCRNRNVNDTCDFSFEAEIVNFVFKLTEKSFQENVGNTQRQRRRCNDCNAIL